MKKFAVVLCTAFALTACHDLQVPTGTTAPKVTTAPSPDLSTTSTSAQYVAIDLGTLGGSTSSAVAINARSQVVGYSGLASGIQHAFLWEDGVMTDLGDLGGGSSYAYAVNGLGQVTGWSSTDGRNDHAFLWSGGRMEDLGTLGGNTSVGVAINSYGQVVGTSTTADGSYHAFLYDGTSMIDLGSGLDGSSYGVDLNDAGQVAVTAVSANRVSYAFVWDEGKRLGIATLGGPGIDAYAINSSGEVTGESRTVDGAWHAYLWLGGNTPRDLGALGGGASFGYAINDAGDVTGESYTAAGDSHAILWSAGSTDDLGAAGAGTSSGEAINRFGQVAGEGSTGTSEFFLWDGQSVVQLPALSPTDACAGVALKKYVGFYPEPKRINDGGQVVGYSCAASGWMHATVWRKITPVEQVTNLITSVDQLQTSGTLGQGEANSLTQKLLMAEAMINDGKKTPAVNKLQAFINEVQAMMSGTNPHLTSEQGQPLIDAAQAVIDRLGG